jgi:GLPGLI family protein
MKVHLYFFLVFYLVGFLSLAEAQQTIVIDYYHSTQIEGAPSKTSVNAKLISNRISSSYEMDYLNNADLFDEEDDENGKVHLTFRASTNPYIYKDYENGVMYSKERISVKPFIVKDSLNIFDWKLTNNSKKILNFSCQEAKLNYRGRQYIAYFTTELGHVAGPWKFSKLPGTILEIKSVDGAFEIEANRVQVLNEEVSIPSPYKDLSKSITYQEFLIKYRKKYNELLSYSGENNVKMSLPRKKIELLIED